MLPASAAVMLIRIKATVIGTGARNAALRNMAVSEISRGFDLTQGAQRSMLYSDYRSGERT
jgi:hypothetical protein